MGFVFNHSINTEEKKTGPAKPQKKVLSEAVIKNASRNKKNTNTRD